MRRHEAYPYSLDRGACFGCGNIGQTWGDTKLTLILRTAAPALGVATLGRYEATRSLPLFFGQRRLLWVWKHWADMRRHEAYPYSLDSVACFGCSHTGPTRNLPLSCEQRRLFWVWERWANTKCTLILWTAAPALGVGTLGQHEMYPYPVNSGACFGCGNVGPTRNVPLSCEQRRLLWVWERWANTKCTLILWTAAPALGVGTLGQHEMYPYPVNSGACFGCGNVGPTRNVPLSCEQRRLLWVWERWANTKCTLILWTAAPVLGVGTLGQHEMYPYPVNSGACFGCGNVGPTRNVPLSCVQRRLLWVWERWANTKLTFNLWTAAPALGVASLGRQEATFCGSRRGADAGHRQLLFLSTTGSLPVIASRISLWTASLATSPDWCTQTDRETDTDRQTDRDWHRQTDRQTDRDWPRQTERHTHTHTHTHTNKQTTTTTATTTTTTKAHTHTLTHTHIHTYTQTHAYIISTRNHTCLTVQCCNSTNPVVSLHTVLYLEAESNSEKHRNCMFKYKDWPPSGEGSRWHSSSQFVSKFQIYVQLPIMYKQPQRKLPHYLQYN